MDSAQPVPKIRAPPECLLHSSAEAGFVWQKSLDAVEAFGRGMEAARISCGGLGRLPMAALGSLQLLTAQTHLTADGFHSTHNTCSTTVRV